MYDFGEKVANDGATASGKLSHGEDNVRFRELENAVLTSGITLDDPNVGSTNVQMLSQALARYASGGVFAVNTGSVDDIVLGKIAVDGFVLPKGASALFEGLRAVFWASGTNTGACTVNFNTTGAIDLLDENGDALTGGEILESLVEIYYHYSTSKWRLAPWSNANNYGGGEGGGGGEGYSNRVYLYDDTMRQFSTTGYVDSGIEATITPTSEESVIEILATIVASVHQGTPTSGFWTQHNRGAVPRLVREVEGESDVVLTKNFGGGVIGSNSERNGPNSAVCITDEPGTTSPVTYKIQVKPQDVANTVYVNRSAEEPPGDDDKFCSTMRLTEQ